MYKYTDDKGQLKCSFCGKLQDQVKKLVAGPGVYICDECIGLCNEIIEEELSEEFGMELGDIPKPQEIREILDQYVIGQDEAKKSRYFSIIIYVLMFMSPKLAIEQFKNNPNLLAWLQSMRAGLLVALVAVLLLIISYFISVVIYQNKDIG
jgi:hypothetical protein